MSTRLLPLPLALALVAVMACGGQDSSRAEAADVTPDTPQPVEATPRCTELDLWEQWQLGWADLNHRISVFGVELVPPDTACVGSEATIDFVGGDFTSGEIATDEAVFTGRVRRLTLDPTFAGATRVRVTGTTTPPGTATGMLELDLAAHGLAPYGEFVAWIDGFRFDTDTPQADEYPTDYEPRLGWTSRGLGADVRVVGREGDVLTIAWTTRFEPGLSEDDEFRATMNDAIPFVRVATSLDIAVLGLAPGVAAREGTGAYDLAFDEPFAGTRDLEPWAEPDARRVVLPPEAGQPDGFVALAGFDLMLDPPNGCERDADCDADDRCVDRSCARLTGDPGYYIRALGAGARLSTEGSIELRGYASSASLFFAFRPLAYEVTSRVVRVQLDGAGAPRELDAVWDFGATTVPVME